MNFKVGDLVKCTLREATDVNGGKLLIEGDVFTVFSVDKGGVFVRSISGYFFRIDKVWLTPYSRSASESQKDSQEKSLTLKKWRAELRRLADEI